jgi:hypothetical protein
MSLGNSGGGDLDDAASSSAYIVFFAADEPAGGTDGLAGDIYAGALKLGQNVSGGTITTRDTGEALSITTNTNGAITIDGGTGTLSLGNSNDAKIINIGTGTAADTIHIGDTASADVITIGNSNAGATLALTGGNDWSVSNAGFAVLGVTSDSFTFDPGNGPSYTGSARPTKQVTLVPEYPGAVLTPDNSDNSGAMTSDFCSEDRGVKAAATPTDTNPCDSDNNHEEHNYYSWDQSGESAQDYDIWVRWQVPSDFGGFDTLTNAVQAYGWRVNDTINSVQVSLYDTAGTADAENIEVATCAGGACPAWTLATVDTTPAETYTPGSYATFKIHMTANTSTNTVKVGEIIIKYKAKF